MSQINKCPNCGQQTLYERIERHYPYPHKLHSVCQNCGHEINDWFKITNTNYSQLDPIKINKLKSFEK